MSEINTATKSPAEDLKEAEAALTRAEQAVMKAKQDIREKRMLVLRMQSRDMGNSLQGANINKIMADLDLSDAERVETLATQDVARKRQNVDHYQRVFAAALRESRTINAQVA